MSGRVAEARRKLESSRASSDKDSDTFEDAVDTGSIRSLTRRKSSQQSAPKPAAPEPGEELSAPEIAEEGAAEQDSVEEDVQPAAMQRHSQTSHASLDEVALDNDGSAPAKETKSRSDKDASGKTLSLSSITSALPSMPWSPPAQESPSKPAPTSGPPPVVAPAPSRKLSSPFTWLSRGSTQGQTAVPPVPSPRRNTASSVATLSSNPEMMLSKLDEEGEADGRPNRSSLKDRFKLLRMREEAGIVMSSEESEKSGGAIANLITRTNTLGVGVATPRGAEEKDASLGVQTTQTPLSPVPASPNPALAPGTASGAVAGPPETGENAVDWDLWQSVVYEGPAAVARTSHEELNKAIAGGIPNAIRGVIWQVLAQSKNEGLETVYRELVVRGTEKDKDKDKDRTSNGTSISAVSNGSLSIGKDSKEPLSSASSINSEQSGANGTSSPTEKDPEAIQRAQLADVAERKKREKDDAAMLQKLEKTIRRDLGARTSFSKYAAAQGLQEGLFGVCKAYALFDEGVGYAQGMNFIIMPILFNMPEEEAFCLLVRLMNQYKLRDLFIHDMPGLHLHLYQFERLLEDLEPALYCHLHRRGISPHLYATQWFLTLFAYRFPLQLVLRIYDLILSEGLSAILRFGIVLMQKNATTLLGMNDMAQLTSFLKDRLFDVYIDAAPSTSSILENGFFGSSSGSQDKEVYRADQLVRDACDIKLTSELLTSYTTEWEEKTRIEKEREAELEGLRSGATAASLKIRRLEERIEAVDREQAALATDLVRTKVENEELRDENESLKGQVRELRLVIEKQPEEIEEAWKAERDNLMARNTKVHEENERLEKELAELEESLVQTKMSHAEVSSKHEALTRRWADIKKQMSS